ncbi:hypothetical protein [Solimicrobium silvestre]|uniref:Uncharacterized protein n=1 Tax=Solimicrobium silvestre TaxID=2099400 RepID=A0A2S9H1K1_9BURK|nr:hypothetical protein [Solimicrobium silvestre]PRC93861.1 hypothetical protein S2091_1470 [Solimicrobium silvestre]
MLARSWRRWLLLLRKYQALLHHSQQRLQVGERRLTHVRQRLAAMEQECDRLQGEIGVQEQLAHAVGLDGAALGRQQLFDWLRKSAADRRRSQALRLELRRQQELCNECTYQVSEQHAHCLRLEQRRERYRTLLDGERKKVRLRQLEIEECEIEERVSWSK